MERRGEASPDAEPKPQHNAPPDPLPGALHWGIPAPEFTRTAKRESHAREFKPDGMIRGFGLIVTGVGNSGALPWLCDFFAGQIRHRWPFERGREPIGGIPSPQPAAGGVVRMDGDTVGQSVEPRSPIVLPSPPIRREARIEGRSTGEGLFSCPSQGRGVHGVAQVESGFVPQIVQQRPHAFHKSSCLCFKPAHQQHLPHATPGVVLCGALPVHPAAPGQPATPGPGQ